MICQAIRQKTKASFIVTENVVREIKRQRGKPYAVPQPQILDLCVVTDEGRQQKKLKHYEWMTEARGKFKTSVRALLLPRH